MGNRRPTGADVKAGVTLGLESVPDGFGKRAFGGGKPCLWALRGQGGRCWTRTQYLWPPRRLLNHSTKHFLRRSPGRKHISQIDVSTAPRSGMTEKHIARKRSIRPTQWLNLPRPTKRLNSHRKK